MMKEILRGIINHGFKTVTKIKTEAILKSV